jgi:hypothetical protein
MWFVRQFISSVIPPHSILMLFHIFIHSSHSLIHRVPSCKRPIPRPSICSAARFGSWFRGWFPLFHLPLSLALRLTNPSVCSVLDCLAQSAPELESFVDPGNTWGQSIALSVHPVCSSTQSIPELSPSICLPHSFTDAQKLFVQLLNWSPIHSVAGSSPVLIFRRFCYRFLNDPLCLILMLEYFYSFVHISSHRSLDSFVDWSDLFVYSVYSSMQWSYMLNCSIVHSPTCSVIWSCAEFLYKSRPWFSKFPRWLISFVESPNSCLHSVLTWIAQLHPEFESFVDPDNLWGQSIPISYCIVCSADQFVCWYATLFIHDVRPIDSLSIDRAYSSTRSIRNSLDSFV